MQYTFNNGKDLIRFICWKYNTTQKELIKNYNQKYNTKITESSFNRSVNTNTIKLSIIINICKLYNCTLDVKEN